MPIQEGPSYLIIGEAGYSPWMASNHMQSLYNAVPQLERFIRMVPGLYSAWLRAWGSQIGKGFMPQMHFQVLDRGLLHIGDGVLFGHDCLLSSHLVRKRKGKLFLYVKKITIDGDVLVGACSKIGPGCKITVGTEIPFNSIVSPIKGIQN